MRKALLAATAGSALMFGVTGVAHAGLLTAGTTEYFSITDSNGGVALGAQGSIGYNTVTASQLVFALSLQNTSFNNPNVANDNRLISFGLDFNKAVSITLATSTTNASGWDVSTSNFPDIAGIDVCVTDGNNCSGGRNGGLQAGGSLSMLITLNGTFPLPLALNSVAARWQSTGPNQAGSDTASGALTPTPTPTPAPEPMSLALFGVGLAGLGMAARRRLSKTA